MRPAIAALCVLIFTFIWNDFFWATVLIQSEADMPSPAAKGVKRPVGRALAPGERGLHHRCLAAGLYVLCDAKAFHRGVDPGSDQGMTQRYTAGSVQAVFDDAGHLLHLGEALPESAVPDYRPAISQLALTSPAGRGALRMPMTVGWARRAFRRSVCIPVAKFKSTSPFVIRMRWLGLSISSTGCRWRMGVSGALERLWAV